MGYRARNMSSLHLSLFVATNATHPILFPPTLTVFLGWVNALIHIQVSSRGSPASLTLSIMVMKPSPIKQQAMVVAHAKCCLTPFQTWTWKCLCLFTRCNRWWEKFNSSHLLTLFQIRRLWSETRFWFEHRSILIFLITWMHYWNWLIDSNFK